MNTAMLAIIYDIVIKKASQALRNCLRVINVTKSPKLTTCIGEFLYQAMGACGRVDSAESRISLVIDGPRTRGHVCQNVFF